jgi:hypothetical protein
MLRMKSKPATRPTAAKRKQLAETQAQFKKLESLSLLKTPSGHDDGSEHGHPHFLRWTIPTEQPRCWSDCRPSTEVRHFQG